VEERGVVNIEPGRRGVGGRFGRVLLALGLLLPAVACGGPAAEPDLAGEWHGRIDAPGTPLDIGVTLTGDGGTLDLPAQGLADLPLADVRRDGGRFTAALTGVPGDARFDGRAGADATTIDGDFTQHGATIPFHLERGPLPPPARPQEPAAPYPYRAEDVTLPSGDLTLAGTLTLPTGPGPFPAVVLISGSGPQDRDETISGHRPFLVVADALTRAGFAVLRADDRGVGGSGGSYPDSTYPQLADDALAQVAHLAARPEIDRTRIGLFGHSWRRCCAPATTTPPAG
jgi:hypothetical protein